MKKKSLVLALALLSLVGCDTKKDDTKEVQELKQEIEDLKANVKELKGNDDKKEVDNNKETEKSKLLSMLEENPNIDPYSIDENVIKETLNSPTTIFDKFISESAKNSGADEIEAARGMIGYVLETHNMQGFEISSVPIYSALEQCVYNQIYKNSGNAAQQATVDVGLGTDYSNIPINNLNLLIDKSIATKFKDFKKAYSLKDLINLHEQHRFEKDDPILNSIVNFKGEFGYSQEEYTFPGGVHVNISIGGDNENQSAYFFYVSTEPKSIKETEDANLWAIPIAYADIPMPDLFDPNYDPNVIADHLKLNCFITGPGLEDF